MSPVGSLQLLVRGFAREDFVVSLTQTKHLGLLGTEQLASASVRRGVHLNPL